MKDECGWGVAVERKNHGRASRGRGPLGRGRAMWAVVGIDKKPPRIFILWRLTCQKQWDNIFTWGFDKMVLAGFFKVFFFFFGCGPFLKSLLNLLQHRFCFMLYVFWPWGTWNLSSPTSDQAPTSCTERQSINRRPIREVPRWLLLFMWRMDEKEKIEWTIFAKLTVVKARDDDGLEWR